MLSANLRKELSWELPSVSTRFFRNQSWILDRDLIHKAEPVLVIKATGNSLVWFAPENQIAYKTEVNWVRCKAG